ncbi:MAG: VanZ family protein [Phycisphaerae bacterium]|nr:VanZ family protein [Phycisphaerae bacterium]
MSTSSSGGRVTPWAHFWRRMLPAYWIFLFCSTHFPHLSLHGEVPGGDKTAHLVAFAILALVLWLFAETLHRPPTRALVWKLAVIIAAYAAFDEITQPVVGRSADFADWGMDMLGSGVVLAALEIRRSRAARA